MVTCLRISGAGRLRKRPAQHAPSIQNPKTAERPIAAPTPGEIVELVVVM
jgi:hypothetical protein